MYNVHEKQEEPTMATKASMLYLNRKKVVLRQISPSPKFPPSRLPTHSRPHDALPELQNPEQTDNRLAAVPIEDVKAQIDREIETE